MWEYNIKYRSDEIWNDSQRIAPYLKDWIHVQRWAGTSESPLFTVEIKDKFNFFTSPLHQIIGFIIDLKVPRRLNNSFSYFIPLEMAKNINTGEIFKFPIILKCKDENIYIREADASRKFFQTVLNDIVYERNLLSEKANQIQFKRLKAISPEKFEVKLIRELGGGDTTNTNYKITTLDDSCFVIKIYRIFSKNPEVKMLKSLYANGFHKIPQPLAYANVRFNAQEYSVILLYTYLNAVGDGGLQFWNDLTKQLNYWRPRSTIEPASLQHYCERLGETIAEFHFHSSRIPEELFKPEPITREDIITWIAKIEKLFVQTEHSLNTNSLPEFAYIVDESAKILKNYERFWKRPEFLQKLEGIMKIKIHQDLHLSQMLTIQSNNDIEFILIDFEGDPLLSPFEKFQKDPFFRDLASISTAFHYIKFNALMEYFAKNSNVSKEQFLKIYQCTFIRQDHPDYRQCLELLHNQNNIYSFPLVSENAQFSNAHVSKLISFARTWEDKCRNTFLSTYLQQLVRYNLTFNFDLADRSSFNKVLELFRIERFVKEFYYESFFRKNQILIPIFGLFELGQGKLGINRIQL
ncbi:MAG: aminoglycoside phosphotransferase family protein [Candidatus Helarchaeota archaeon]